MTLLNFDEPHDVQAVGLSSLGFANTSMTASQSWHR